MAVVTADGVRDLPAVVLVPLGLTAALVAGGLWSMLSGWLWVRFGASVVISSRKLEPCEEVAAGIRANGGKAVAIAANISRREELENLIAQTRKQLGPIDALICNAASNPYFGPSSGMGDEVFQKVMQNNVLSNHWLSQLVYPEMKSRGGGAIVIVSSIGGLKGSA